MEDFSIQQWLVTAVQELFLTYYLRRRLKVDVVLTEGELQLRQLIKRSPPIPLQPPFMKQPLAYRRFVNAQTVQDILDVPTASDHGAVDLLMELAAPDLSEVPLSEIAKLKVKDRLRSLATLAIDLRARYGGRREDIARGFVDALWDASRRLQTSGSEAVIGVLGNVPVPIVVNPIGLLGVAAMVKKEIGFRRDYQWYLTLADLRSSPSQK